MFYEIKIYARLKISESLILKIGFLLVTYLKNNTKTQKPRYTEIQNFIWNAEF